MDPLGWIEKPDLLRLITIEPSHFSDGFEQTITKIEFGGFSCCYNLVSLDLSSLCNFKEIESCAFQNMWLNVLIFLFNFRSIKLNNYVFYFISKFPSSIVFTIS